MKALHATLLAAAIALTTSTWAFDGGNPPPPRDEMRAPPPPPPPMFDANLCKGKAAGTVVETTAPDGRTIKGTCQVVFLPERPPCDCKSH